MIVVFEGDARNILCEVVHKKASHGFTVRVEDSCVTVVFFVVCH
ncbi:BnaC08g14810D [Brassica napus]|nr:unnamed protein product [Brassica napus]CDY50223.1 BnaC08g14810D [Brassica napus]VDD55847.1 unnamed protein product [Brassica oleracea]